MGGPGSGRKSESKSKYKLPTEKPKSEHRDSGKELRRSMAQYKKKNKPRMF